MGIPLLSFFTGGGLLDLGFEAAGFKVHWTNECNHDFGRIYEKGMTTCRRSRNKTAPAAKISSTKKIEELKPARVLADAFGRTRPAFFGVIGGPPCTDFSNGGLHAGHDGEAGKLTSVYVRMLIRLKPDFFLLENVPHLETNAKHRQKFLALLTKLEAAGYSYVWPKLNALEYGVPQDRLRLFVVGFRKKLLREWYPEANFPKRALQENFKWPAPTHGNAKARFEWPKAAKFGGSPKAPGSIPLELCVYQAVSKRPDPESLPNG